MKCAVFYGKHDLRIEERPVPQVRPDEVLVRVMACGVCGTDVHIYEGDKGAADCPPGTVLGHEFAGVVEKVGEAAAAVSDIRPGDRVCVDPNRLCGHCDFCRGGKGHFCSHMTGIGTTVDGGFAQYCSVPVSQVYPFGEELSFAEAAMTEPAACCLHGIDLCELHPGDRVLVIGGGMIGQLMLQLARLSGAAKTALMEPVAGKRALAEKLGASLCIDPRQEDPAKALAAAGMGQTDVVIECAGRTDTIGQALELAGKKAIVMLFGLTKPDAEVAVRPFLLFEKELTVKASYINPYTQGRALSLIEERRLDVSSMTAGHIGLEELEGVLSDPAARAKGKFIVTPWG